MHLKAAGELDSREASAKQVMSDIGGQAKLTGNDHTKKPHESHTHCDGPQKYSFFFLIFKGGQGAGAAGAEACQAQDAFPKK